jgi:hypothetical protein
MKAAKPDSTQSVTMSIAQIAMFTPAAVGESLAPKQTGHASNGAGASRTAIAMKEITIEFRIPD